MISGITKPILMERCHGQLSYAAFRVKNNGFSSITFIIVIIKVLHLFIYSYCMFICYLVNYLFILLCIIFICLFNPLNSLYLLSLTPKSTRLGSNHVLSCALQRELYAGYISFRFFCRMTP